MAIVMMYPTKRRIHVFLDNARYHHAVLVEEWLARQGCRIKLHFIPGYCPHLNPIERLWGLMHQHVTHNRCYATYNDFCRSVLNFLRKEIHFCDSGTDNFRVINPADFRVLKAWRYTLTTPGSGSSPLTSVYQAAQQTITSGRSRAASTLYKRRGTAAEEWVICFHAMRLLLDVLEKT
jgi:hypothetical protein